MKLIDISTPKYPDTFAMVDDEDFERLNQWKWHYSRCGDRKAYVFRTAIDRHVRMHREVIGAPASFEVDHINGNTLDNRKTNLRLASSSQNKHNQGKRKSPCSSRFKGVSWRKRDSKFAAYIGFNKKKIDVGRYLIEEDAARAYNAAAIKLHGEFAKLNNVTPLFPKEIL